MATKKIVKSASKVLAKKVVKKTAKKPSVKVPLKKATTKSVVGSKNKKLVTKKATAKTTKPVAHKAVKKIAPKIKKTTKNTKPKIDYFKLPFEVYYSEYVPVTQIEFKSDVEVKKFKDIKAAHKQQGGCWGLLMECSKNNGPELYCCITNNHDEADPSWLHVLEEDDISFNYGHDYKVVVKNNTVQLAEFSQDELNEDSEQYISSPDMDYCCEGLFVYHLDQSSPDYLILDSRGTRIKVDLEGYVLDDDLSRVGQRVFEPDELDEDELDAYEIKEFSFSLEEWVGRIIKNQFPKERNLRFLS